MLDEDEVKRNVFLTPAVGAARGGNSNREVYLKPIMALLLSFSSLTLAYGDPLVRAFPPINYPDLYRYSAAREATSPPQLQLNYLGFFKAQVQALQNAVSYPGSKRFLYG